MFRVDPGSTALSGQGSNPPVIAKMSRRLHNQRRWSLTASARHRRQLKRQLNPPVMWNIQGMRGKMPSNCLWHACQALVVGILLFSIGGVMSFLGFEADGVFTSNGTAISGGRDYFYEDARGANVKFSKLSFAGPIVMGVGGFIIVAACVMTFEARDSAAKVGPAAFVASDETEPTSYPIVTRTRPRIRHYEVRSVAVQTCDHSSSDTLHNLHIFDKKNILETFRKFSKTIRQSSSKEDDIHRYPSAPNLFEDEESSKTLPPKSSLVAARRSSCLPKFRNRVPPTLVRQAMSIDCSSSSPFLQANLQSQRPSVLNHSLGSSANQLTGVGGSGCGPSSSMGYMKLRRGISRAGTNASTNSDYNFTIGSGNNEMLSPNSQPTSRTGSTPSVDASCSTGITVKHVGGSSHTSPLLNSGTVDLHLPNGMVTLNVIHTTGGSMLGSSTCLRTLSPHPSYHSQQSDDSSFDMGSVKSDNILLPRSPMRPYRSLRSESFGRPALVRQSKVDQTEVIYIPDSDEEQPPIPEEEHESELSDAEEKE